LNISTHPTKNKFSKILLFFFIFEQYFIFS